MAETKGGPTLPGKPTFVVLRRSSLLGGGLLSGRLLGRGLLGCALLGRRLLSGHLLGRGLLGCALLGRRLLSGHLLGRGLLGCALLGRGLLSGRLLGRRLLSGRLLARRLLSGRLLGGGNLLCRSLGRDRGSGKGQLRQLLGAGDDRLQFSYRTELRDCGLFRLDALTCTGVANPPCVANTLLERTKPRDGDLFAPGDLTSDGVDHRLQGVRGAFAIAVKAGREGINQLTLVHYLPFRELRIEPMLDFPLAR